LSIMESKHIKAVNQITTGLPHRRCSLINALINLQQVVSIFKHEECSVVLFLIMPMHQH
jgi:hypothetical protein